MSLMERTVSADYNDENAPIEARVEVGNTADGHWGFVSVSRTDENDHDGPHYRQAVVHMSPRVLRTLAFDLLDVAEAVEFKRNGGLPEPDDFDPFDDEPEFVTDHYFTD